MGETDEEDDDDEGGGPPDLFRIDQAGIQSEGN